MNKSLVFTVCVAAALSSCGTYTGDGAATGAMFGSVLGSAIGGISGGPRGSDVGTVVGMAGGAVLGAVVGSAADEARQEEYRRYMEYRDARYGRGHHHVGCHGNCGDGSRSAYVPPQAGADESGFDPTNSGDDRIVFEDSGSGDAGYAAGGGPGSGVRGLREAPTVSVDELHRTMPGYKLAVNKNVEVRNISFVDASGDGALGRREGGKVSFEIMNCSGVTLYDVHPTVVEATGNKHIHISPPLRVESIAPGRGVRYTASVYADSRVKDGEAVIRVGVVQGDREITSLVREFRVPTLRR